MLTSRSRADAGREAETSAELALAELRHRAANDLSVASAILNRHRRAIADPVARAALDEAVCALEAVSLVHRLLDAHRHSRTIDLAEYLSELCRGVSEAYLAPFGIACLTDVHSVNAEPREARTLGLIACELVRNSAKHAFPSHPGTIAVRLRVDEGRRRLTVSDDGCGMDRSASSGTRQGLVLVRSLVTSIQGKLTIETSPRGTTTCLSF